jgi:starch-binding outer membrane protein SusE/F
MKNIIKILLGFLIGTTAVLSCKKDEKKVFFEGGTAPVLTASSTSPKVLNIANRNDFVLKFDWTNPDYVFNTGLSSQNVTYILQMDTMGANFTSRKKYEKAISNDLTFSMTVGQLNTGLLGMDLKENMPHTIEIRIKATLINSSVPLYSNVIKMVITPYLDVLYPVPAKLYITGKATPGDWMSDGSPELASQRFTQISSSEFELASLAITGGEGFLFVPVYGNWSNKYGFTGTKLTNNVNGDSFKPGGEDFKAPASGNYRINVSFKTGTYTFTKL